MIRHLPENVVPFEDCGYARHPRLPLVGREIMLDCESDETPRLEWSVDGAAQPPLAPERRGEGRWRFALPAFGRCARVRYRFAAAREATRWFDMDILRQTIVERPARIWRDERGLCAALGHGLTLRAEAHAGELALRIAQDDDAAGADLAPSLAQRLRCCERAEFCLGEGGLWTLLAEGQAAVRCERLILWLDAANRVRRTEMALFSAAKHYYGTGERFDAVDQRGRGSCGRVVERFTRQGEWSYLPVPLFLTEKGFGWFRRTWRDTALRFESPVTIAGDADEGVLMEEHWLLGTPAEQLRTYLRLTGRPALPPEWSFGVWMSANGWHCDADVDEQLRQLRLNDYPASVMVLEAWSDENTFWHWHDENWPDPAATVRRIRERGLHLVLWQIPVLKQPENGAAGERQRREIDEAIAKGYCVLGGDGQPYRIPERWFAGSLLPDFSNPDARSWWFARRKPLLDMGVEGFKTDGGEFLFDDAATLHDGMRGDEAHNAFPMLYAAAYHDFLRENGVDGLTFSRAGGIGAQSVPAHWAGDQLSEWDELRAQLRAGLSAGLSGVLFWGFDIGGFAGPLPDAELYLRATALGCFSPIMQWHAEPRGGQFYASQPEGFNNDRSPWNLAKALNDPALLEVATRFARLRERMRPYLWAEAQYCVEAGRPLMAHLCLDFPGDERALACEDEFMLGRKLLVAPVVEARVTGRRVYLPAGKWRDVSTDEVLTGGEHERLCPMDRALAFERMEA